MTRLPIRLLGLFLLTTSLSVSSCQAFVHTLTNLEKPNAPQQIEQTR